MRTQQGEFETDFAIYCVFLTPLTNLLADSLPYMQSQAYRQSPAGFIGRTKNPGPARDALSAAFLPHLFPCIS